MEVAVYGYVQFTSYKSMRLSKNRKHFKKHWLDYSTCDGKVNQIYSLKNPPKQYKVDTEEQMDSKKHCFHAPCIAKKQRGLSECEAAMRGKPGVFEDEEELAVRLWTMELKLSSSTLGCPDHFPLNSLCIFSFYTLGVIVYNQSYIISLWVYNTHFYKGLLVLQSYTVLFVFSMIMKSFTHNRYT